MKKKLLKFVFAVLLCCGGLAQAANITFIHDANIQAGDSWSNVSIYDTFPAHTTVNMTGGLVDSMNTYNTSTLNIHGGQIINGIYERDHSTVNIFDCLLGGVSSIYNYANINVYGGTFSQGIHVENFGVVNIRGGAMGNLSASNFGIINLYGGFITDSVSAWTTSVVNVFGYNLTKTATGGTYGCGQITGFWQNGSPFTIDLRFSSTYSVVNLIPEPATFLLLGAGAFILRKSKKQTKKSN